MLIFVNQIGTKQIKVVTEIQYSLSKVMVQKTRYSLLVVCIETSNKLFSIYTCVFLYTCTHWSTEVLTWNSMSPLARDWDIWCCKLTRDVTRTLNNSPSNCVAVWLIWKLSQTTMMKWWTMTFIKICNICKQSNWQI